MLSNDIVSKWQDVIQKSAECVCQPTCVVGELNRVDRVHLEPQDLKKKTRKKTHTFQTCKEAHSESNTVTLKYSKQLSHGPG